MFKLLVILINFLTSSRKQIERLEIHQTRLKFQRLQWDLAHCKVQQARERKARTKLQEIALVAHANPKLPDAYISVEINDLIMWMIKQNGDIAAAVQQAVHASIDQQFNTLVRSTILS